MLFLTFFSHRCTTATWNFLISGACFTEQVNTTQKVSFPFSKLRYGPFEFNPENFTNIWQIKWNWIRSLKFEPLQIYFLSEFSVCCHPKFCYGNIMWRLLLPIPMFYSSKTKLICMQVLFWALTASLRMSKALARILNASSAWPCGF